jgi:hypothetical protein
MAFRYASGIGVDLDPIKSEEYFELTAERGYAMRNYFADDNFFSLDGATASLGEKAIRDASHMRDAPGMLRNESEKMILWLAKGDRVYAHRYEDRTIQIFRASIKQLLFHSIRIAARLGDLQAREFYPRLLAGDQDVDLDAELVDYWTRNPGF